MKLRVETYEGYRNMPTFVLAVPEYLITWLEPEIYPVEFVDNERGDRGEAFFIQNSADGMFVRYRLLVKDKKHGNPAFGYEPAGYEAGWSSRASVVNRMLNRLLVDVNGIGVTMMSFLNIIDENYEGDVFIAKRVSSTDMEYIVAPYVEQKQGSYASYLEVSEILSTRDDSWRYKALQFLL